MNLSLIILMFQVEYFVIDSTLINSYQVAGLLAFSPPPLINHLPILLLPSQYVLHSLVPNTKGNQKGKYKQVKVKYELIVREPDFDYEKVKVELNVKEHYFHYGESES